MKHECGQRGIPIAKVCLITVFLINNTQIQRVASGWPDPKGWRFNNAWQKTSHTIKKELMKRGGKRSKKILF
jgi:hypothetical protein